MLNRASSKIGVENGVNVGDYFRIGWRRARYDGLGTHRHVIFEENSRAEAQVGFGDGKATCAPEGDAC